MKRILLISMVLSLGIIGCKENKKEDPAEVDMTSETVDVEGHSGTTQEPNHGWEKDIVLNNDNKWQANKETTDGVMAMLSLINENQASTTNEYKKLGKGLNEVKNTVVKECTMKGESHDNLHVWLHPLIEKIEMLQNAVNTDEGEYMTTIIKKHLEGYSEYFN